MLELDLEADLAVCTVLFLAQKSNQNTWFSTILDFFLDFRWFSAFFPTLCTVLSKNQAFLFWRIIFRGFLNPSKCLIFLDLFSW
jgi:hypothetical protein